MRHWMMATIVMATTGCGWFPALEPAPPETAPDEQPEPPETTERQACNGDGTPPICNIERQWGSAIVLDELTLEGTPDDPVCGVDMTGDGVTDNSAGVNIAGFSSDPPQFQTVAQRVTNGNDAIVLELEEHRVQWWPAAWGNAETELRQGMDVLVESYALNNAQESRFAFTNLDTEDGLTTSRAGKLELPIVLFGAALRVEAEVVEAYLNLEQMDDGHRVTGQMGVRTGVDDVVDAFNSAAASCECLDSEVELLVDGECAEVDRDSCSAACQPLIDACPLIASVPIFADIDTDSDGLLDAISAGYTFTGVPASITGIAR